MTERQSSVEKLAAEHQTGRAVVALDDLSQLPELLATCGVIGAVQSRLGVLLVVEQLVDEVVDPVDVGLRLVALPVVSETHAQPRFSDRFDILRQCVIMQRPINSQLIDD